MNRVYRLATNNQVRKESWGLLFYSSAHHRISFVRSGDWLYPYHFDGSWTFDRLIGDIVDRSGETAIAVEQSIRKLIESLTKNGMIVHELC